jgi:hypothetical protein
MTSLQPDDPVASKDQFLGRLVAIGQLNPSNRCYVVRGLFRENWTVRACDAADILQAAWSDPTGRTHWTQWLAAGVCQVDDFAEMIAVLGTNDAESAYWRKVAALCCLRNGVEKEEIRVTSGDASALMAFTERTHLSSAAVWRGNQPVGLNDARIDMDAAVHWLHRACDHLLPESLRSYLKDSIVVETNLSPQPKEVLTLKPTFMGMSVDLKELFRSAKAWWKRKK